MKPWLVALIVVAAAAAGFATGRAVSAPVEAMVPRSELARAERERDDAALRAQRADAALAQRPRAAPVATEPPQPEAGSRPRAAPPAATNGDGASTAAGKKSEAERLSDVHALVARIDPAFDSGDGESALEVLRKLAGILPEGRQPAMDLAVRMHDDVNGAGTLHLDLTTFYMSLGDTDMLELMVWSMENTSPPAFRVISAWSLPWVLKGEKKVDVLVSALTREKEAPVLQALAANLAQMYDPKATSALVALVGDKTRDAATRAMVVTYLAAGSAAELTPVLQAAAGSDPDDRVRAAARQALIALNPPVDGYLITTTMADGAALAAGMRVGDVMVSYDGKPTRATREIQEQTSATGPGETAPVVVLRESGEVTLQVRRGRMGINGRPVKRR